MTDRELLEFAAKAAGFTLKEIKVPMPIGHRKGVSIDKFSENEWSPLHDDGDALRLAVSVACRHPDFHTVNWNWTHRAIRVFADGCEGTGSDEFEKVRRAIVCRAAEIGKAL